MRAFLRRTKIVKKYFPNNSPKIKFLGDAVSPTILNLLKIVRAKLSPFRA